MRWETATFVVALLAWFENVAGQPPRVFTMDFFDTINKVNVDRTLTRENTFLDYNTLNVPNRSLNVLFRATLATTSVFVTLDKPKMSFCERARPFALFRNTKNGKRFRGQIFPAGQRMVTALPYRGERCTGEAGELFAQNFTVIRLGSPQTTKPPTKAPTPSPTRLPTNAPVTNNPRPKDSELQPKITLIESNPAQKLAGIMAYPEGSPWCRGAPTVWTPGHRAENDSPFCFINGKWARPFWAQMDDNDDLNDIDGPEVIDRHDCGAIDVNQDGELDIYCQVGANSGRGFGYNELYLTQSDGSLQKVERHGLQKHPGMRGRYTTVLNGKYVVLANKGVPRQDKYSNRHAIFKAIGAPPYFREVVGPWRVHTNATSVYKVDLNSDGLDDVILTNRQDHPRVYIQPKNEGDPWREIFWNKLRRQKNWRKIRMGDFNGDGIPDLLVSYFNHEAFIRIFPGIRRPPYVNFDTTYFNIKLDYAAPDVEMIDVDGDGRLDVYVSQSIENPKHPDGSLRDVNYCTGKFKHGLWWRRGNQPPPEFIPPNDQAADVLLLNRGMRTTGDKIRFDRVDMDHSLPGCGNLVRPFGNKKLILTQGDFVRPGYQYVLDWN